MADVGAVETETHLIAYVKMSKLTDWKRIALGHRDDDGRPTFVYRSHDNTTFKNHAKPGSVLWVLESQPGLAPSLAARLDVVGQIEARVAAVDFHIESSDGDTRGAEDLLARMEPGGRRRWYAVGDPATSRFYGHNDIARAVLCTHVNKAPWEHCAEEWRPTYGRAFNRPRRVLSGHEHLVAAAERLERRSVFLSWKHHDLRGNLDGIRDLASELAAAGFDCWWDKRALPPSAALRALQRDDQLLGQILDEGLRESRCLLAIGSPNYGQPSRSNPDQNWTRREWERSPRRLTWSPWGTPDHGWPDDDHTDLSSDWDAARVARHVAAILDAED